MVASRGIALAAAQPSDRRCEDAYGLGASIQPSPTPAVENRCSKLRRRPPLRWWQSAVGKAPLAKRRRQSAVNQAPLAKRRWQSAVSKAPSAKRRQQNAVYKAPAIRATNLSHGSIVQNRI
jgi:hypothetical protein